MKAFHDPPSMVSERLIMFVILDGHFLLRLAGSLFQLHASLFHEEWSGLQSLDSFTLIQLDE